MKIINYKISKWINFSKDCYQRRIYSPQTKNTIVITLYESGYTIYFITKSNRYAIEVLDNIKNINKKEIFNKAFIHAIRIFN